MGTKNNPGNYDCYANAEPDEPIFILRGSDPTASFVVSFWVAIRKARGKEDQKYEEARDVARAMEAWARGRGKDVHGAYEAFQSALDRAKWQNRPSLWRRLLGR